MVGMSTEIKLGQQKQSYTARKIMKNKKIKCDIYTRVSTTMQVDGYSLDAQKEKLKRYAEFQNMEIVNEYSDEGKSGKSVEGRPEFQRMLDNIENGTDEVQFVLVFKLSRFTFV